MALLLGLVVSSLFGVDIVSPQIKSGALITYGLSFFLAFFDDLPVSQWERQGRGWRILSFVLGVIYWVVLVLALLGISIVFTLSAIEQVATPALELFMSAFGFATVAIGLLVGVGGLATRIKDGSQ